MSRSSLRLLLAFAMLVSACALPTEEGGASETDGGVGIEVASHKAALTGLHRTVVFIQGTTQSGQDMFIRGGLDHEQFALAHPGQTCTQSAETSACAIPISHRNLRNDTTKWWKQGDTHLDWYGAEAAQNQVSPGHGLAEGSAADWTTNNATNSFTVASNGFGFEPLNQWGDHYWMLDVDMDCSRGVQDANGDSWFELKTFISNGPGWEPDVAQAGGPYVSRNHWAKCGQISVFRRGSSDATFLSLDTPPPPVGGVKRVKFNAAGKYLMVEVLRDDILHFELGLNAGFDPQFAIGTSPMVLKRDYPGPTAIHISGNVVETPAVRATVNTSTLCVIVFDKVRNTELSTTCPEQFTGGWGSGLAIRKGSMWNAYGLGNYFDYGRASGTAEGDWVGSKWFSFDGTEGNARRSYPQGSPSVSQFPVLDVLGSGNTNYTIFFDHTHKYEADFSADWWKFNSWGTTLRWYLITGPDLPDLRKDFMDLTGKPRVPPRKAFGLWVSKFGYRSWDGVERALSWLQSDNFPVDGFALDLFWFGGNFINDGDRNQFHFDRSRFGSLRFDESRFGDPAGKLRSLASRGVGIMPIEESVVSDGATMWNNFGGTLNELKNNDYVAQCGVHTPCRLANNPWWGQGWYLDWTNARARQFWHDNRRKFLTDIGVVGHWCDLGEPEINQYAPNAFYQGIGDLHSHNEIHNLYGFFWMQGIAEGYARNGTPARPFMLTRAAAPGVQRFGATMWSGDINANHESLRAQINSQMHMSLAGVDYYGSDAGGFFGGNAGSDLYRMWLADNAMTDFPLRPHSWAASDFNDDVSFAPNNASAEFKASNRATVRMKYELIPYSYSLAHRANRFGEPITPPVFYYYQSDAFTRTTASQKMSGRDLLFGLGTEPGQNRKDMYLPADAWYDYLSDEYMNRTSSPTLDPPFVARHVDFDFYRTGVLRLPLFARGGAIIPIMKVDDGTADAFGRRRQNGGLGPQPTELVARVFAGPNHVQSEFTVFEDDGTSVKYESGEVRTTRITQLTNARSTTVTVDAAFGSYDGAPSERNTEIWYTSPFRGNVSVTLNGVAIPPTATRADFDSAASACYFVDLFNGRIFAKSGSRSVATSKVFVFSIR